MNKKIIIVSAIILCVIALGVGIYFAWQKTRVILTPPDSSQNLTGGQLISPNGAPSGQTSGSANGAVAGKLNIVSDQTIYDYWIFNSTSVLNSTSTNASSTQGVSPGNGVFYLNREGKIFKVKADGADEAITSNPIENFQSLRSSFDGKRVVIKYGDLNSPKFTIYNAEANIFEILPDKITAADFSPDAKKIAYLGLNLKDASKSDLIIKNAADSKQKPSTLMSIYQSDFGLQWVSQNKILLVPKSSAFTSASIWAVDVAKKILSRLTMENSGLIVNWSFDGKTGLQFSSSMEGRNRILSLINDKGEIRGNLEFITLPEKCFVSDPKIYCAIPQSIPDVSALPDDYFKNAVYFADSLYQIDITSNSFERIFDGSESAIDAINLKLVDSKLFFINKYDNKLYALGL